MSSTDIAAHDEHAVASGPEAGLAPPSAVPEAATGDAEEVASPAAGPMADDPDADDLPYSLSVHAIGFAAWLSGPATYTGGGAALPASSLGVVVPEAEATTVREVTRLALVALEAAAPGSTAGAGVADFRLGRHVPYSTLTAPPGPPGAESALENIWLNPDLTLAECGILPGDELKIKHARGPLSVKLTPAGSTQPEDFSYGLELTVRELLDSQALEASDTDPFGLYYPHRGIFLQADHTLDLYDIEPQHVLEVRRTSSVFLLRIRLPERANAVVTFRLGDSQPVADVVSQLARKIPYDRATISSLYDKAGSGRWLDCTLPLSHYQITSSSQIEYKTKFSTIHLTTGQGPSAPFVSTDAELDDLLDAYGPPHASAAHMSHTLLDASGGRLDRNAKKSARALLSSPMLPLTLRPGPVATFFGLAAYDPSVRQAFELDPTRPLRDLLAGGEAEAGSTPGVAPGPSDAVTLICRRFGIRPADFAGLALVQDGRSASVEVASLDQLLSSNGPRKAAGAGAAAPRAAFPAPGSRLLDVSRSLLSQGVFPGSVLIVHSRGNGWSRRPADTSGATTDSEGRIVYADTSANHIWADAEEDAESNLTFEADRPRVIASASLNKLIERLTDEKSHDMDFVKTILLTYHSFTTPAILLSKIIERYNVPRPANMAYDDFDRNSRRLIHLRVVNVLKHWIEKYSSDFFDPKSADGFSQLAYDVARFARNILHADNPTHARMILQVLGRLKPSRTSDKQLPPAEPIAPASAPTAIASESKILRIFRHSPQDLAEHITATDFELFAQIKPAELLNQNWNRADAEVRSANVLRVSRRFNRVVLWVVASILIKDKVRKRAERFAKLIEIAQRLYHLKNFSSVMAFIAGFNSAAISRLKWTRAELPGRHVRILEDLEQIMTAQSNYKAYRALLHNSSPPLVPYIGVYLADLTFIDDGNPNRVAGLINIAKRRLDYSVISEIQMFQNEPYPADFASGGGASGPGAGAGGGSGIDLLNPGGAAATNPLREQLEQSIAAAGGGGDINSPDNNAVAADIEQRLYDRSLQVEPRGAERAQIE
ncbi:hypothetical protein H696_05835 [Fonticula alba]|uniref:Ras-GEF domain-containing protein n=1 Tax=Fonticula alba TaxID=691883 RepID=A0A058Z2H3_FONAL|nr:hypothetical protein H696_05835 [Fonticula alba]KCV67727.1 hypothetical protein H696_05835 [Fonticula alba]|eukprot:XP_009497911.1 hypothetical protein H696_05835 [Fonticula alba]